MTGFDLFRVVDLLVEAYISAYYLPQPCNETWKHEETFKNYSTYNIYVYQILHINFANLWFFYSETQFIAPGHLLTTLCCIWQEELLIERIKSTLLGYFDNHTSPLWTQLQLNMQTGSYLSFLSMNAILAVLRLKPGKSSACSNMA